MSEVADIVGGGTPRTSRYDFWEGGDVPWITPADLSGYVDREISSGARNITSLGLDNSSARLIPAGSVLFSSRAPVGYVAIASNSLTTNQGFKSFVLSDGIIPEFVYYYLQRAAKEIIKLASGTTFLEISARKCASIPIPIAPTQEQRRIVAKLDASLSRMITGESAARRALDRLRLYRAAVLRAAVTGELTRTWRETHKSEETGAQILQRLMRTRRDRWEKTELKRLRSSGKVPKSDAWKARYREPIQPDIAALPRSSRGWTWMTIDQTAAHEPRAITDGPFGSNLKTSHYTDSGARVIRLQNIGAGIFIDEKSYISRTHYNSLKEYAIYPGDLVIRALGIPAPRACRIPKNIGAAIVKADCIRLKVASKWLCPDYVMWALNSPPIQRGTEAKIHGVGRPRLNLGEIRSIAIPLPPVAEQIQIVRKIDSRFAAANRLAATVNGQFDRARATRQSLLGEAFSGRLVPQDSNDELASILVDRIRRVRETEQKKPKEKRMPKSKSQMFRRPLLDVLREQKKPISPEQLFREAGFEAAEADLFYRELASLRKLLREKKPMASEAKAWPHRVHVMLALKES
jgi:type I restriction enzyme S subunit